MKKSRGALVLILVLLGLAATTFFGIRIVQGTLGNEEYEKEKIGLGLDLAGGVSITYEVEGETPTSEQLSDTIYKLQQRVQTGSDGSITEAQVYAEGDDRINVDIPGGTDEIFAELQEPGKLEFIDEDGNVQFDGEDIQTAKGEIYTDESNAQKYAVSLTFKDEAADAFYDYTSQHIGDILYIYYNGEAISAPQIRNGISGGVARIDGMSSYEEAENIASFIRIGTLDLTLKQLRAQEVSATLGKDALSLSIMAAGIGLLIVILFMIIMYRMPGAVAGIGLIMYTGLMMIALRLFDITLTLPGIAGIILSIGMAVDANVIIFARIREEIATGKTVASSIKLGYKKALSAIIDGNVTTLIAAVVLGILGSGAVKGFAYTLGIGIVLSMFTALVITRFLLQALFALGLSDEKFYGRTKERKVFDFVGKKGVLFIVAALVILVGAAFMGLNASQGKGAMNYSLDFVGGTSTNVTFNEDLSVDEIEKDVVPVVSEVTGDVNVQIQKVSGTNAVILKTKILTDEQREELNAALVENFKVDESLITFESISSVVSEEMRQDALVAVLVAMVLMLLYIWFRFKDFRFSASAVLALVHDVLVVLACYAIVRISVGNTFIAVMLTIVGYSINATIVIFDRIRENMGGNFSTDPAILKEVVNKSITQTLSRSINTSVTTFVMVAVLYILGVATIREFALPLMAGIVAGAYSSVCLTGSIWYLFRAKRK